MDNYAPFIQDDNHELKNENNIIENFHYGSYYPSYYYNKYYYPYYRPDWLYRYYRPWSSRYPRYRSAFMGYPGYLSQNYY